MVHEYERLPVGQQEAAVHYGPLQAGGPQPADNCCVIFIHSGGTANNFACMTVVRGPHRLAHVDAAVHVPEIHPVEPRCGGVAVDEAAGRRRACCVGVGRQGALADPRQDWRVRQRFPVAGRSSVAIEQASAPGWQPSRCRRRYVHNLSSRERMRDRCITPAIPKASRELGGSGVVLPQGLGLEVEERAGLDGQARVVHHLHYEPLVVDGDQGGGQHLLGLEQVVDVGA